MLGVLEAIFRENDFQPKVYTQPNYQWRYKGKIEKFPNSQGLKNITSYTILERYRCMCSCKMRTINQEIGICRTKETENSAQKSGKGIFQNNSHAPGLVIVWSTVEQKNGGLQEWEINRSNELQGSLEVHVITWKKY